ncbi:MAG: DsbA family protein [Lachnospiraceae bacterium]|nr:DsbA family protein [Lachnospiraceae bacterium]MBQ8982279.1 DsbA family protein [Lachnospiraceae bacterium]
MDDKIILTVFTDPMMGLSYESEPIIERLRQEYNEKIEIRYVMSLLVKDVSDFMTYEERSLNPTEGIRVYNKRLAKIYKSEEAIGGLPINMDDFRLFDEDHRSSKPLNLAYKAAQLAAPDKADLFLKELRHATVVDCLPTTHTEEILKVAQKTGINSDEFHKFFSDGSAERELEKDLVLTMRLGIHSLPSYLIQNSSKALIMQSFDYNDFANTVNNMIQ